MTDTIKEKTFEEVYLELKELCKKSVAAEVGPTGQLSAQGKQYFVFPHVEENGFDTWQKIYDEIVLIIAKNSHQSKAVRESLITVYHNVTQKTIELNNLIKK